MKIGEIKALARQQLLGNYANLIAARLLWLGLWLIGVLLSGLFLILGILSAGKSAISTLLTGINSSSEVWAVVWFLLFFAAAVLTILFDRWLSYGYRSLVLKQSRGKTAGSAGILLFFRGGMHPWKVFWTSVLKRIFVALNAVLPWTVYACGTVCGADFRAAEITNIWLVVLIAVSLLSVCWAVYLRLSFVFAENVMIEDQETDILDALRFSMKLTRKQKFRILWLGLFSFLFWDIPAMLLPVTDLWILSYKQMTAMLFYRDCRGELAAEVLPAAVAERQETVTETEDNAAETTVTEAEPEEPVLQENTVQFPDIEAEPEKNKEEEK